MTCGLPDRRSLAYWCQGSGSLGMPTVSRANSLATLSRYLTLLAPAQRTQLVEQNRRTGASSSSSSVDLIVCSVKCKEWPI